MLTAVEARNASNERLIEIVNENTTAVRQFRGEVVARPTRWQVEYRRRRAIASLVLFAAVVVGAHDIHVEQCGPGGRAERAIEAVVDARDTGRIPPGGATLAELQRILGEQEVSPLCDVLFPVQSHERGTPWPSVWALLGIALYAVVGMLFWLYVRAARRADDKDQEG